MRSWRRKPVEREYVSEIDRFLMEFDKNPLAHSVSRRSEEANYLGVGGINEMRDNPGASNEGKYDKTL